MQTPTDDTDATLAFMRLTPDCLLDALESLGLRPDGRLLALNSYENRVYRIGMDEAPMLVAKFYRPARWSERQIGEEHEFLAELVAAEIPAVAPLSFQGRTLHCFAGLRFALFPLRPGRAPELDHAETLEWLGRYLARIHNVGATQAYAARPRLDRQSFGVASRDWLLAHEAVPGELLAAWRSVADAALDGVAACYARAGRPRELRLHGDCHMGNVLWTQAGPHFVDFDDSRMGPAVQDLWMLLPAEREEAGARLRKVLAGYEQFRAFERGELHLVEALRTLRLLHYSAWIARRWQDPAFPAAFPWFATPRYWEDRILELREQIALMQEPPLDVD